jgi:hypothetical protein
MTNSASALQDYETENGDIVVNTDLALTMRTMGWGKYKRFFSGNPEDADIEKASHNGPEEEGKNIGKNWIHLFSPLLYHRKAAKHSDQNP